MDQWIDISEYASKYGVSISTLRRRIRSKSILFKLERGKYLLQDSGDVLSEAPLFSRRLNPVQTASIHRPVQVYDPVDQFIRSEAVIPVDLKEDFERLKLENRKLKNQIAELQTLIKMLESQVEIKI